MDVNQRLKTEDCARFMKNKRISLLRQTMIRNCIVQCIICTKQVSEHMTSSSIGACELSESLMYLLRLKDMKQYNAFITSAEMSLNAQSSLRNEKGTSEYSFQDINGLNLKCVERILFKRLSNSSININTQKLRNTHTNYAYIYYQVSILSSILQPFSKLSVARRITSSSKCPEP